MSGRLWGRGRALDSPRASTSWRGVLRRARSALLSSRRAQPRRGWSLMVPATALAAGLLFSTTATTARGTALREDRRPELAGLISERRREVARIEASAGAMRHEIDARTREQAGSDNRITEQRTRATGQEAAAGFTRLHGPGITVRLDDAPRRADGIRPAGASVDDLVVHQQDVQAVVNAFWAGGADAVAIMNIRVISTSAVRCVGNTLLLDGRVYSPPFVLVAIGDSGRIQRALDSADGVRAFRAASASFGLGYQIKVETDVGVPAYDGSTALSSAQVPE